MSSRVSLLSNDEKFVFVENQHDFLHVFHYQIFCSYLYFCQNNGGESQENTLYSIIITVENLSVKHQYRVETYSSRDGLSL